MNLERTERNDTDENRIEDIEKEFRERFREMESGRKGQWAEVATINEADTANQIVLVDHPDNPNRHGFDCVSIDPSNSRLHIWEAKNYGENTTLKIDHLTAWKDIENEKFRDGFLNNVREVIHSVPEGEVRDTVRNSIAEGNVTYHLRVGPETRISKDLEDEIRASLPDGVDFDVRKYSAEYMRKFDIQPEDDSVDDTSRKQYEKTSDTQNTNNMEWEEKGIVDVPVEKINVSDSQVNDSTDFHKVSEEEMLLGFEKLQNEIHPAVKDGARGDDFSELDRRLGLDYEHGYRRVYDAFYGNEPIRLEKDGNEFSVVNGYHRLSVAKKLGIESIPASVIERKNRS